MGAVILAGELNSRDQDLILLLLAVAGIAMSLLGFHTLKLESAYFNELRLIWMRIYSELNRHPGFAAAGNPPSGIDLRDILPDWYFTQIPPNLAGQGRTNFGVRSLFRIVMVVACAVFIAIVGFAMNSLLNCAA